MAKQLEVPEERLKSFLNHLQAESGILDRIIYKNKNQHRRCSYFQYLLKVRRDLKLFHSIHMEEVLDSCFNVITGRKAKQKAYLLESLKRRKCDSGNFNFMERLQGAARLLSEMVEPMLKAATEISILLARSFFMGFSVMVLALLARLRVLVQQMLVDVVSVYNEVSSLAQKVQSIKINQDGIEVFREYYPTREEEKVVLECVWKIDKFILVETKCNISDQGASPEIAQTPITSTKYRSIATYLGDDQLDSDSKNCEDEGEDSLSIAKRRRSESPIHVSNENNHAEQAQMPSLQQQKTLEMSRTLIGGSSPIHSMNCPISSSNKSNFLTERVAFVSVRKAAPSKSSVEALPPGDDCMVKKHCDEDISLFTLLSEGETEASIF